MCNIARNRPRQINLKDIGVSGFMSILNPRQHNLDSTFIDAYDAVGDSGGGAA